MRTKLENFSTTGNRTNWYKKVTSVDTQVNNGYAFDGIFLKKEAEIELNDGDVIIEKCPRGSNKHRWNAGVIYKVINNRLEKIGKEYDWGEEFLSFRDKVAEILNEQVKNEPANPLKDFSDDELIAELKRRNIIL